MIRSPFEANCAAGTTPGSMGKVFPIRLHDSMSHKVVVRSFELTANRRPSGENEICEMT